MFILCRYRRNVPVMFGSLFLSRWTRFNATRAAVVADAVLCAVHDRGAVDIANHRHIHVADGAVIEEVSVVPAATFETYAEVSEAVIDSTVESDMWTPVPRVKK